LRLASGGVPAVVGRRSGRRAACRAPATSWGEEQREEEHEKEEERERQVLDPIDPKKTGEGQNGYFMCLVKRKYKQNL
jgi:hypothetical protein